MASTPGWTIRLTKDKSLTSVIRTIQYADRGNRVSLFDDSSHYKPPTIGTVFTVEVLEGSEPAGHYAEINKYRGTLETKVPKAPGVIKITATYQGKSASRTLNVVPRHDPVLKGASYLFGSREGAAPKPVSFNISVSRHTQSDYSQPVTLDLGHYATTSPVDILPSGANLSGQFTFASSDRNILTISISGRIVTKGVGDATITQTDTKYNISSTKLIHVAAPPLTSFSYHIDHISVPVGSPAKVRVSNPYPTGADIGTLTFTSSAPQVATIDPHTGVITTLSVGTTNIRVTSAPSGVHKSVLLRVTAPVVVTTKPGAHVDGVGSGFIADNAIFKTTPHPPWSDSALFSPSTDEEIKTPAGNTVTGLIAFESTCDIALVTTADFPEDSLLNVRISSANKHSEHRFKYHKNQSVHGLKPIWNQNGDMCLFMARDFEREVYDVLHAGGVLDVVITPV